jgi:choline-sulfatase
MPTALELTGQTSYFEPLPGRSLLPLLEEPQRVREDRAIVADYACDGTRVPMRMVRRGRWKGCFALGFPPVLFDLDKDPHEWQDIGHRESAQAVLGELHTVASADGWDPERLREEILLHKRRLKYIHSAESRAGDG